jgi:phosphoribosylformimino-5-aminoimidazole carboxamide ribotide isomerase
MRIIPVMDIRGGRAVAGKSGKREEYAPLKTVFADSSDPLEIASALPYPDLYVADLDGVVDGQPDLELIEVLAKKKHLLCDSGIRTVVDLKTLSAIPLDPVLGTETAGREVMEAAFHGPAPGAVVSLDIKDGAVLSDFLTEDPEEALVELAALGAARFILLDISSVGTLGFGSLRGLIGFARRRYPGMEIYAGGGIRKEDLAALEEMGVTGALVGTALHRGEI